MAILSSQSFSMPAMSRYWTMRLQSKAAAVLGLILNALTRGDNP